MSPTASDPVTQESSPPARNWFERAGWIVSVMVLAASLAAFYQISQKRIEKFNPNEPLPVEDERSKTDRQVLFHHDQHVYLNTGRMMKRSGYEYVTPRHRTPGYPFLLSFLYSDDDAYTPADDQDPRKVSDAYFSRAKTFNVLLSLGLIVVLFGFAKIYLPVWESLFFTLVLTWHLFVFKACYVQPELLYYTLLLIGFVLLWLQIGEPVWRRGIIAGVVLAAVYMLKSSVLPMLALFVACFAVQRFLRLFAGWREGKIDWRGWWLDVAKGAVIPVIFVALLSPYLLRTWKMHGSPFWSVHSHHYFWMENGKEKNKWQDLDLADPETVVPPEVPTMKSYLAGHTWEDIVRRIERGRVAIFWRVRTEYTQAWEIVKKRLFRVCLVIGLLFLLPVWRSLRKHWVGVLFMAGYFAGYIDLYSWYETIGAGPRLILSVYPALVFVLVWFLHRFAGTLRIPRLGWRINTRFVVLAVLFGCLAAEMSEVLRTDVWRVIGGG